VLEQGALVVAPRAVDLEGRNAPSVGLPRVQLDVVFRPRQALAKAVEAEVPPAEPLQLALEVRAEPRLVHAAPPALATGSALVAVPAQEVGRPVLHVAEARHVDAVGPIPVRGAVFVAWNGAVRAAAHAVVHQVLAELAAGVREPVRELRARRVQQDPGGFARRGAE